MAMSGEPDNSRNPQLFKVEVWRERGVFAQELRREEKKLNSNYKFV